MADVRVIDTTTGKPKALPQEAVATAHARKEIAFPPGTRVPAILDGQPVTLPAEQVDAAVASGRAKLDLDPSGAVKAAAAGAARGLTFGASDWLAIEGQKLLGDHEGAEHTRKVLEGLQTEHETASGASEIVGGLAGLLVPGEQEVELGNLGRLGAEGSDLFHAERAVEGAQAAIDAKDAAQVTEAAQTAATIRQQGQITHQVAQADAASGRTIGSALGTLFRHSAGAPQEALGALGGGVEEALAPLFGGRAAAVARAGAEGMAVGAANAADESELGDTDLTGEALWTGMEHGAAFGVGFGLVGSGAERILTGAGKLARRVAEGRLGGTAWQYRQALERWGPGGLGARALEEGLTQPFLTDSERFDRASAALARDGSVLHGIAKEADESYNGMNAAESRAAMHEALDRATEDGRLVGGNLDALNARLKAEYDKHIGWRPEPSPLPPIPEGTADALYDAAWRREAGRTGLLPPDAPPPPKITQGDVRGRWRELADAEGLGMRPEKIPQRLTPEQVQAYKQKLNADFERGTREERSRIGVKMLDPHWAMRALPDAQAEVVARNARRLELQQQALEEVNARYATQKDAYDKAMQRHVEIKQAAEKRVAESQADRDRTAAHLVSANSRANAELRVPYAKVREFRAKVDGIIPYGRSADAMTNAAVDMKHATRRALEGHLEASLDQAARKGGDDIYARYVHAKARYGQAKDIVRMVERARGREASWFGREVFGHHGGLIGHGLQGLMFGHPIAGIGVGLAKKHAPTVMAWAAHKVAHLAELRALRSEVLVAVRRSARAAAAGTEVPRFAQVAVPSMAPHELRMTAAQAMVAVAKVARGTDLVARLAALHPSTLLIAPKSALATEGSARRALTWMASNIPARIQAAIAQGHTPTGRDLSDGEARKFMEGVAVAHDPRVASDALAHGQLTPHLDAGWKAVAPGLRMQATATAQRQAALDRESFDRLPMGRRSQLGTLGVSSMPMPPPGMTLTLQRSAIASTAAGATAAKPGGMVHASSGLAKSSEASMLATMTDSLEGSTAGRRRRSGP